MFKRTLIASAMLAALNTAYAENPKHISLEVLGTYETGVFDESAAEIVAHDPASQRLFVINANAKTVDILDISDPNNPTSNNDFIDVSLDLPDSGGVNSVAVRDGIVTVAVEHDDKQENGWIAFYDTYGNFWNAVRAGALPDMVTFTHNGNYVLGANEGEPSDDYTNDPEGSVTVVDLRGGVMAATAATADFSAWNGNAPVGVRISGPGASVAQDLEPEYIVTSQNSKTAWVALQENNALAEVDIPSATVTTLTGLGYKDHSASGNGLDASNEDNAINITNWPVFGTYMPDGMDIYKSKGKTYLVMANEGDGREYIYEEDTTEEECKEANPNYQFDDGDCFSHVDEARIKDVDLDSTAFPNAGNLQKEENLGRLKMLTTQGDTDGDGDYDILYSFGARSFTIRNTDGSVVYDSGDSLEKVTAAALPDDFNSTNDENGTFDDRSDDKGPEPENVVVGKVRGQSYAFIGLERVGGIAIYNVTDPTSVDFVDYVNNRDFMVDANSSEVGDLGPEGLLFIKADDSPNGKPLLVVGNEVSGTTTIYRVTTK